MLVVGLGNPGRKYEKTRHNVGFMFVDRIANYYKWKFKVEKKHQAMVAEGLIGEKKVRLVKPIPYMNNSGLSVYSLKNYYNITDDEIIIVYDDIDILFANIRIRKNGSSGGHKGMNSIINQLSTEEIKRIRIGIGPNKNELIDFVLSPFKKQELKELNKVLDKAPQIIEDYLNYGFDFILQNYNG